MSSSPSEMCLTADSVPSLLLPELPQSSEELEGDAGPPSRPGGGGGRGASSSCVSMCSSGLSLASGSSASSGVRGGGAR